MTVEEVGAFLRAACDEVYASALVQDRVLSIPSVRPPHLHPSIAPHMQSLSSAHMEQTHCQKCGLAATSDNPLIPFLDRCAPLPSRNGDGPAPSRTSGTAPRRRRRWSAGGPPFSTTPPARVHASMWMGMCAVGVCLGVFKYTTNRALFEVR